MVADRGLKRQPVNSRYLWYEILAMVALYFYPLIFSINVKSINHVGNNVGNDFLKTNICTFYMALSSCLLIDIMCGI